MPSMFARGILFGKMVLELGETITAKNEKTGMSCDVEFKTKGFFSGTYNAISGKVKKNGTDIGEVSGRWSHIMEYKPKVGAGHSCKCDLFLIYRSHVRTATNESSLMRTAMRQSRAWRR